MEQIYAKPRVQASPNYTNQQEYLWTDSQKIYSGCFEIFRNKIEQGVTPIPQFARYGKRSDAHQGRIENLLQVIGEMKSDKFKARQLEIREAATAGDEKRKAELKATLPYITHSGIFIPRKNEHLRQPGFTYQLDIDKIKDGEQIIKHLVADPQLNILFITVSPSGNGVKALLFLKELVFLRDTWTHEQYKSAYHQLTDTLERYFLKEHSVQIDTQMKAISQPFYLLHAPNLITHKNYRKWF